MRLAADFLAVFSGGAATSASVESSLTVSGSSVGRSIVGAFGAEEGGPAGRLAARRRRGAGFAGGSSFVSCVDVSGSWGSSIKLLYGAYAHFLIRCTGTRPGCGSLRNRCGESGASRGQAGCVTLEALLVAVEDQIHLRRDVSRRACLPSRLDAPASKPSPVSHTSQLAFAVCRSARICKTGFGDGSGFGIEPALGEPCQDRRLNKSKLGACGSYSGQHVVGSD